MMFTQPPIPAPPVPPPPPPVRTVSSSPYVMLLGILLLAGGAWAWAASQSAASACSSLLVNALESSQCDHATNIHTMGEIGFFAGLVLAVMSLLRLR